MTLFSWLLLSLLAILFCLSWFIINNQRWLIDHQQNELNEKDREWCQIIESVLGWHPVGQTDFLNQGLKRYSKEKSKETADEA